ncbi:helix-turn-helix transcriptional regulator [Mycolicibacterium sp. P1-5]|uniref:helix-turn-helix transcriptional regulator n=1 Tax=Mycolicibacterium sp. P1-5 TaxID=2024617 RepID=UPI0011EC20E0|nr:helix-turn-helix transcriptional regulator [Mycolicibacterium sp. P1-5]KAA0109262.1 AraC family transcriptional regulator [Mycolicibacterium sp. P1-5]
MEPAGPFLHRPAPPLSQHISYIGYWNHSGGVPHRSTALPRGAVTMVIELSGRERVDFAAVGAAPAQIPSAFITGAGTTSYVTQINPGHTVMTVHFRPAGARPFLPIPLGELQDRCVGIEDVWGPKASGLRELLIETTSAAVRFAVLERFLLNCMHAHDNRLCDLLPHLDTEPFITVAEVAALTGLSSKRLAALFSHEVGLGPKTYLRVRRLQAALRRLDSETQRGAEIAADLGYFDQAHFVRDFRSFTSITPSQYLHRRSTLPSHLDLLN